MKLRYLHSLLSLGFLFLVLFTTSFSPLFAQERKYVRKSVTSLGTVIVKKGNPDVKIISSRLKANIELPRFDYNQISESASQEFVAKIRNSDYSEKAITTALEQTVMPKILAVVKAVAEERAKGNLSEEALARAAVEKLKGSGLTAADIQQVLNSAYLYLPVVTDYTESTSEGSVSVNLEGYVLWFKVVEDQNRVIALESAPEPESGNSSAKVSDMYSIKNRQVDGTTYARLLSANTWAKNIAQAMKKIPDFKLAGGVRSVEGNKFTTGLGTREGVGLDDGFEVYQEEEDESGKAVFKRVGFARVEKVGDNTSSSALLSELKNYIGRAEEGQTLNEHPQLGIDVVVRPKYGATKVPEVATFDAISSQADSYFGVELGIWFNAAKITGSTQLFFVVDLGGGILNASYSSSTIEVTPLVGTAYAGVVKKFWFGRANFNLGGYAGVDALYLMANGNLFDVFREVESVTIASPGIRLDAGLEYLFNPDLSIGVTAQYKLGFDAFLGEIKYKNGDTRQIVNDSRFKDVNFSGLSFGAYVSFSLPSLSTDVMEGLTAQSIEY
ncbi:MAG: hypothetical protein SFU91_04165 [Chloroherpetonaceae bacterium]|nr:hypothetical protein [Chloroherpetonaceae bacterium]